MKHQRAPLPATRLGIRDALTESFAAELQRPGRAVLTMLGTVLGVGAFVTILGLTSSASGQISRQFTVLQATTVNVVDRAAVDRASDPEQVGSAGAAPPPIDFPTDADQRIQNLNGVQAAGLWWTAPVGDRSVRSTLTGPANGEGLKVYAATPGAVRAMAITITEGVTLDPFMQHDSARVILLSAVAANRLGIDSLATRPAVYVGDLSYTVAGVYTEAQRNPEVSLGAIIPASTALADFGNPDPGDMPATMVIATKIGAAQLVARQAPLALRPDNPDVLAAIAPPDPRTLREKVSNDLTGLFIALAAVSLVIGAVGIANTTLVSVLERVSEIGLRRSLGARPVHIAEQFLIESLLTGTIGGILGTSLGIMTILVVAAVREWTAILDPAVTLAAPVLGSAVGLLAGLYPALRAAKISPIAALRS